MPKVIVPNIPMRRHPETREWVPAMDITPAERRGEISVLFSQEEVMAGAAPCEAAVDARLRDSSPEDFLLFIGDPAIMIMTAYAFARRHPGRRVKLLKWDRRLSDYLLTEVRS